PSNRLLLGFGLAPRARVAARRRSYPSAAVFDSLSDKLQHALGELRGRARLEADVNLEVIKGFVARVKERAVGETVTKSLTPGQEVVKIVHDELTATM